MQTQGNEIHESVESCAMKWDATHELVNKYQLSVYHTHLLYQAGQLLERGVLPRVDLELIGRGLAYRENERQRRIFLDNSVVWLTFGVVLHGIVPRGGAEHAEEERAGFLAVEQASRGGASLLRRPRVALPAATTATAGFFLLIDAFLVATLLRILCSAVRSPVRSAAVPHFALLLRFPPVALVPADVSKVVGSGGGGLGHLVLVLVGVVVGAVVAAGRRRR